MPIWQRLWHGIARLLSTLGIWLLAMVLLFEEWGWEHLAAALAWIGRLPGLRWIERRIRALPPYAALALFLIPLLSLLPFKLLALYWLSQGHAVLGLGAILLAKVVGTAVTARLFMLTQPTLMRLAWFARWFTRWMAFKNAILARVRASAAWRQWTALKQAVQARWRRLRDRWR
jgi:hypothetical protein